MRCIICKSPDSPKAGMIFHGDRSPHIVGMCQRCQAKAHETGVALHRFDFEGTVIREAGAYYLRALINRP